MLKSVVYCCLHYAFNVEVSSFCFCYFSYQVFVLFCFEHLFMYLLIGEEHCCGKCVEVRGQLKGIGSSFPSVGPVAQTQIIQLGVKCFSPIEPSHSPRSDPIKVESCSPL